MLKYLIIQLCDTSTSYCHYENENHIQRLINLEDLKKGIFFAMKQNLMIQFVYPDKELTQEYKDVINTIDHNTIVSSYCDDQELVANADIVIFHDWTGLQYFNYSKKQSYVLRTKKEELFDMYIFLKKVLPQIHRLNIVLSDVETFTEEDYEKYRKILSCLAAEVKGILEKGGDLQLNLLTDRLYLHEMNNCNAGLENITLAPDGRFYTCPAFYLDGSESLGNVNDGLNIKNARLFRLDYAPICRHCDAYHCKRCVWLNKRTTLEINTPSHQQCVISHIERNTSKEILNGEKIVIENPSDIPEIDYLDPFDVRDMWDQELLKQELIKFHKENY